MAIVKISALVKYFVEAKAWQLFLVMLGVPFLILVLYLGLIGGSQDEGILAIMIFCTAWINLCVVTWAWSIGRELSLLPRREFQRKATIFNLAFLYFVLFVALLSILAILPFGFGVEYAAVENPAIASVVLIAQAIGVASGVYVIGYSAKTLVTTEWKQRVRFLDYVGTLLAIWVFFLGVWSVQPRVRRALGK